MMNWIKTHHVGLKILAALAAIALWAFAIVTENPERTMDFVDIHVQLIGEASIRSSQNLIVTDISDPEVSVRLRGSFTRLGEISENNIIVRADVSRYTEPGTFMISYDVSVPNGVTVDSKSPEKIRVTIDKYIEKELDVRVEYDGQLEEGLELGEAAATPRKVKVNGIASVLDNAQYAVVQISAAELTESFSGDLAYYVADADGKPLESEYTVLASDLIHLDIPVYMTKDLTLEVEKIGNDIVSPEDMNVSLSTDVVTVRGEAELVRELDSIRLGSIDVRDFRDTATVSFPLELPEGVELVGTPIHTVSATATLDNIELTTISISSFEMENKPEDLEVTIDTFNAVITVRGRSAAIRGLTADDFRASVDIAKRNSEYGRQLIPIKLECLRTGVEILGEYSIIINVPKPPMEEP